METLPFNPLYRVSKKQVSVLVRYYTFWNLTELYMNDGSIYHFPSSK